MNAAVFATLDDWNRTRYVGPIRQRSDFDQKAISKLLRLTGFRGSFPQYSHRRLVANAKSIEDLSDPEAKLDFFYGFTPWSMTRPAHPYVALSDCTFHDYLDIYHRRTDFQTYDVARIESAEATWLSRASRVVFTSKWAADNAVRDYGLDDSRVNVVGIFGEVEPPERDLYQGEYCFAFVSTNFEAKGGPVVLEAIERVRCRYPMAELVIVGDNPGLRANRPGVTAIGFLQKEDPDESRRFLEILGRSRAIVHPTRSDVSPHILVEAAMFGCPGISSRRFAIPEILEDGRTGILLNDPNDPSEVAKAMIRMLEDPLYPAMRRAAWINGHQTHTKARFEERLRAIVTATLMETGRTRS